MRHRNYTGSRGLQELEDELSEHHRYSSKCGKNIEQTFAENFKRKYQNTYVYYKRSVVLVEVVINHADCSEEESLDNITLKGSVFVSGSWTPTAIQADDKDLYLGPFESKLFSHNGNLYLMSRNGHKQWKWGLNSHSYDLYLMTSGVCKLLMDSVEDPDLILSYFKDPIKRKIPASGSYRISNSFYGVRSEGINKVKYLLLENSVGEIKGGNMKFKDRYKYLKEKYEEELA